MYSLKRSAAVLLMFLFLGSSFRCQYSAEPVADEITNLVAFAKLYGYVKYFHPSDEARLIDWDEFAVYGVQAVKGAKTRDELKAVLDSLFLPIAPTLHIRTEEKTTRSFLPSYLDRIEPDTSELQAVAWQHRGVDVDGDSPTYSSIRVNSSKYGWDKSYSMYQEIDLGKISAKQFRLQANAKMSPESEDSKGEFAIIPAGQNSPGMSKIKQKPLAGTEDWSSVEIIANADEKTGQIGIGVMLQGTGTLWIDDITLSAQTNEGEWITVPIKNTGFEKDNSGQIRDWILYERGFFKTGVTAASSSTDRTSFKIESPPRLFEQHPKVGETFVRELTQDLYCEIPLALYSNGEHTLPQTENTKFEQLQLGLEKIDPESLDANNEYVRLADIIISWNIFQHFYPYFDVVNADW